MAFMTPLRVLIAGGGIGGLCLAQGLRRAGVPVTVFERTESRTDWLQGYRIHINPHGSRALRNCLDPAGWQEFLDTASTEGGGFAFVTEGMDTLLDIGPDLINRDPDPANHHHGVSRITLRQVLLSGMDEEVEFGKTFERYEVRADGRVTAQFTDGTSATGDLLIGADGADSRVRSQLLPHAHRIDVGAVAVAGKHRLTDPPRDGLPAELTSRANMVVPRGRGFMFTAVWRAERRPVSPQPPGRPGLLLDNTVDYAFWAYAAGAADFPDLAELRRLDGGQLRDLVSGKIPDWSPQLRGLVAGSDPDTVNAVRIRSAARVKAWPTGPVTLLGDAIHDMTPMGGIGANTALRDADLLRRQLIAVHQGRAPLATAIRDYERQMLDYGFAAVRRSLRNARQAGSGNRLTRGLFRTALRTTQAITPLKRRMAASLGS